MSVNAVASAMEILELLADSREGVGVSELSDRFDMNKGSVSRLLTTLEQDGYVVQDPSTGRYGLTLKLVSLVNRYCDRLGFPAAAQPILNQLAQEAGELVQLAAGDGEQLYVIAKAEGDERIRITSLIGRAISLHASATARAWLSALPADEALALLARQRLHPLTPNTTTDLMALRRELEKARTQGFACQDEELMEHLSALAVPVCHRATGAHLGALAVVAPAFRFPYERKLEMVPSMQRAASQIAAVWPNGFAYLRPFRQQGTPATVSGD